MNEVLALRRYVYKINDDDDDDDDDDFVSEIQFLEQNYDIVKCNIWMRQVAEIQNKVKLPYFYHFCVKIQRFVTDYN